MKIELSVKQIFEAKYLVASIGVRYWEDALVNGVEDTEGTLIPCREDDYWCPQIDIDTGQIVNWEQGKTASIHYKSCDDNEFSLYDERMGLIKQVEGYVIRSMNPKEGRNGDYVIMDIDENGMIDGWKFYDPDFNATKI